MTITYPQTDLANYTGTVATIHTNLGDLTVKLFDDVANKELLNSRIKKIVNLYRVFISLLFYLNYITKLIIMDYIIVYFYDYFEI